MVKNNRIVTQTWECLVTHMYIPIQVTFSIDTKDTDGDYELGKTLADEEATKRLDILWDGVTSGFTYKYDLGLET